MVLVQDEYKPTPDTVPRSACDEFDDAIDNQNGRRGGERKYFPKALPIGPRSLALAPGKMATLAATVSPAQATRNNVIWESSDPTIAAVDKFGRVTAHRAGEARIAVYSWDDAQPLANNAPATFSRGGITDAITVQVR